MLNKLPQPQSQVKIQRECLEFLEKMFKEQITPGSRLQGFKRQLGAKAVCRLMKVALKNLETERRKLEMATKHFQKLDLLMVGRKKPCPSLLMIKKELGEKWVDELREEALERIEKRRILRQRAFSEDEETDMMLIGLLNPDNTIFVMRNLLTKNNFRKRQKLAFKRLALSRKETRRRFKRDRELLAKFTTKRSTQDRLSSKLREELGTELFKELEKEAYNHKTL